MNYKNYKRIRSPEQSKRCTDPIKGRLYCECGCQVPNPGDPPMDLGGITVSGRANHGYANYTLIRDGRRVGEINTQYTALILDGRQYLGCEGAEINELLSQCHVVVSRAEVSVGAGGTRAETAATVRRDEQRWRKMNALPNRDHPGYCTACHTYCYGDCQAN